MKIFKHENFSYNTFLTYGAKKPYLDVRNCEKNFNGGE